MKRLLLLAAFAAALLAAAPQGARAQSDAERAAVRAAVLDYVEGIYGVDHTRIERSVHPDMAKRGFFTEKDAPGYKPHTMTYAQLVELAKNYNKNGRVPKDAPKEVVVYDISDQTATVKLTAVWGIDYMHLAKYDGRWKIINVLWQTPPKKEAASER